MLKTNLNKAKVMIMVFFVVAGFLFAVTPGYADGDAAETVAAGMYSEDGETADEAAAENPAEHEPVLPPPQEIFGKS